MKRTLHSSKTSKLSLDSRKKHNRYRLLLKQRGGLFVQNNQNIKSNKIKKSNNDSINVQNIKQYIKKMKNIELDKSIDNKKQYKKNIINCSSSDNHLPSIQSQNQKYNKFTLQDIQHKVDQLIAQKLYKTKLGNAKSYQVEKIDQQINSIMGFLQHPNTIAKKHDEKQQQDVTQRKISIIQKLIAQSTIQSQAAKKYFQGRRINRKQKNPWQYHYKVNIKYLKQKDIDNMMKNQQTSIDLQTTRGLGKSSFKVPDQKYYVSKPRKLGYQFKNQPIPRSTYSRDFLTYGYLPRYPERQNNSNLIPNYKIKNQGTSYQCQFTTKKVQKLDFRDLDCYKDKFKNIQISFTNSSKPTNSRMHTIQLQMGLSDKKNEYLTPTKSTKNRGDKSHYIQSLNTEFMSNFKGEDARIKSEIKHKHLSDLKYAYRAYVHV